MTNLCFSPCQSRQRGGIGFRHNSVLSREFHIRRWQKCRYLSFRFTYSCNQLDKIYRKEIESSMEKEIRNKTKTVIFEVMMFYVTDKQ